MTRTRGAMLVAIAWALVVALSPGTPSAPHAAQAQPGAAQRPDQPTFRVNVDLVTTDLIVRDQRTGQFIADLKESEIEVYEDGVRHDIASLVLTHGGKVHNVKSPPRAPLLEGLIVPPHRPTNDAAGRIFVIFIDDLHFDARMTPKTRQLLGKLLKLLIHEGDMFGIVSTGTSSISEQVTYNRQVLESSIERVQGSALRAKEVIQGQQSSQGPTELRHRAHVAFSTALDLMKNLERVQNRRKSVIYISSGYDFNPFEKGRMEELARRMHVENAGDLESNPFIRDQQSQQRLAESDLIRELAEVFRAANRANATIYTIDPTGLVAGQDIDDEVPTQDWLEFTHERQNSLRVIAEETGGFAIVNQNDFDKGLKRIDAETSDYYVLGYYSKNPDPLRRTRRLDVRTTRPGVSVTSRPSYSLPLPAAATTR